MGKLAIVISGGGCKGAFAVGVLKYFFDKQRHIQFDIISGTSTGALMIPSIIADNIPNLVDVYSSVSTEDIAKVRDFGAALEEGYILNTDPLNDLIKEDVNIFYEGYVRDSNKKYYIATTCLQTQKVTYFGNKEIRNPDEYDFYKITSKNEMIEAIKASSFQPVFMEAVKIKRKDLSTGIMKTRQYVDGGVTEYLPIQAVLDAGADKVVSIVHSKEGEGIEKRVYTNVFGTLLRTLGITLNDVSLNDFKKAKNIHPDKVLDPIQPDYVLAEDGLIFKPTEMKRNIKHGEEVAKRWFEINKNKLNSIV